MGFIRSASGNPTLLASSLLPVRSEWFPLLSGVKSLSFKGRGTPITEQQIYPLLKVHRHVTIQSEVLADFALTAASHCGPDTAPSGPPRTFCLRNPSIMLSGMTAWVAGEAERRPRSSALRRTNPHRMRTSPIGLPDVVADRAVLRPALPPLFRLPLRVFHVLSAQRDVILVLRLKVAHDVTVFGLGKLFGREGTSRSLEISNMQ